MPELDVSEDDDDAVIRRVPQCNVCRAGRTPRRGKEAHPLLRGEPVSGSVWNDPFPEQG